MRSQASSGFLFASSSNTDEHQRGRWRSIGELMEDRTLGLGFMAEAGEMEKGTEPGLAPLLPATAAGLEAAPGDVLVVEK